MTVSPTATHDALLDHKVLLERRQLIQKAPAARLVFLLGRHKRGGRKAPTSSSYVYASM